VTTIIGNHRNKMILCAMSRDRAPPIGSVPIYEKSQRKSHITGKIYILLIIDNLYSIFFLCI
jgi:hypothetical protein